MTIEKSIYNFKDDGTLITMPENILISIAVNKNKQKK